MVGTVTFSTIKLFQNNKHAYLLLKSNFNLDHLQRQALFIRNIRANLASFVTKEFWKAVMSRARLRNTIVTRNGKIVWKHGPNWSFYTLMLRC